MRKPLYFFPSFTCALLLSFGFLSSELRANTFDQLSESFEKSDAPHIKGIEGYWSGRCVSQDDPDNLRPGIFAYRPITDEEAFPPTRLSFSYYWHREWAPETFDEWDGQTIAKSPELKEWFEKEQWQKITFQGNSMVNYFEPSTTLKFKREVRFFRDEFNDFIMLKSTRIDSTQSYPETICYFKSKIAALPEESGAQTYFIQLRNSSGSKVRYNFRFGDNYQWSQQSIEEAETHSWNQTVISGKPIIRFDSSFFPGYQMKQYLIESGNYVFVRTAFGIDLLRENCCQTE